LRVALALYREKQSSRRARLLLCFSL